MNSGIYKLVFEGTDKVYIGQSCDLDRRAKEYNIYFTTGTPHSIKLKQAKELFGAPRFEVILYSPIGTLNDLEYKFIQEYDSYNNGFNSIEEPNGTASVSSFDNVHCNYTKEQYIKVLELALDLTNSYNYISQTTGVSYSTVRNIISGIRNHWLAEEVPELYAKVMSIKNCRTNPILNGTATNIVIHSSGVVEEVSSIKEFRDKYNLIQSEVSLLLRGKIFYHKGWVTKVWLDIVLDKLALSKNYKSIAKELGSSMYAKRVESIDKRETYIINE